MKQQLLDLIKTYILNLQLIEATQGTKILQLEQNRLELHLEICELLNIDHIQSKEIFSNLDKFGYTPDTNKIDLVANSILKELTKGELK